MEYNETGLYKFAHHSFDLAKRVVKPFKSKFSKKTYTQPQHVAVLLLMAKLRLKFHETEELLLNSPNLCEALELEQVPDHTTMCRALQRLRPVVFTLLVVLSAGLLPGSGKTAVDSTGFDRRHASKHYVKRVKMALSSMKTTYAVDTDTQAILGVHTTVTRKHDTQIILPLVEEVMEHFPVKVLCADKGYDSKEVRDELREAGVRPLIKHREFKPIHKAHNSRMKKEDYNQRVKGESVNSSTKCRTGDTLTTKTYWRQHKESLIKAITHNIERYISLIYKRIAIKLVFQYYKISPP
jgi:IS5 family transposase